MTRGRRFQIRYPRVQVIRDSGKIIVPPDVRVQVLPPGGVLIRFQRHQFDRMFRGGKWPEA